MTSLTAPLETAKQIARQNRIKGEEEFEKFKIENNIAEDEEITSRKCQRLLKVGQSYFKTYYGLTFISMLPQDTQNHLHEEAKRLQRELEDIGLGANFLFVPPSSYHITFAGVIERIAPGVMQEEVDYYFFKATQGLSNCDIEDLPYRAIEHLRDCLIQLKTNPGKHTKTVDRVHPQSFPFRTILNGVFVGGGEELLYYPFPSKKELNSIHYEWWRSASIMGDS